MQHTVSSPSRVLLLRPALLALAAVQLLQGLLLVLSPARFYDHVADFGAYNPHDLRDVAAFYLAAAATLAIAAGRPSWRVPVLALCTLQYALHALNHVLDAGAAHPAWVGPADAVALAAGALAFGALLAAARRQEGSR